MVWIALFIPHLNTDILLLLILHRSLCTYVLCASFDGHRIYYCVKLSYSCSCEWTCPIIRWKRMRFPQWSFAPISRMCLDYLQAAIYSDHLSSAGLTLQFLRVLCVPRLCFDSLIYYFIVYLCLCWVLIAAHRLPLAVVSKDSSLAVVGFSLWWLP